jgi:hypothetical protein
MYSLSDNSVIQKNFVRYDHIFVCAKLLKLYVAYKYFIEKSCVLKTVSLL